MRFLGRTIALALIFIASDLSAAPTTWACQHVEATGFSWKHSRWMQTDFNLANSMIKIDGAVATYTEDGNTVSMNCISSVFGTISCHDTLGGTFFLNPDNGQAAESRLLGAGAGGSVRDSVVVSLMNCVKR